MFYVLVWRAVARKEDVSGVAETKDILVATNVVMKKKEDLY